MKKILFILPHFDIGGTLTSFKSLLPLIDYTKYEVYVYALVNRGNGNKDMPKEINVLGKPHNSLDNRCRIKSKIKLLAYSFLKPLLSLLTSCGIDLSSLYYKKMADYLSKGKYDIVIAYQEGSATRMAQHIEANFKIAWVHSIYSRYVYLSKKKSIREVYDKYNLIVCVSQTAANDMIKCEPKWQEKIRVVYNVVDDDRIKKLATVPLKLGSDFNIVSVGRIDPVKRFSLIPKLSYELIKLGLQFDWWIIGSIVDKKEFTLLKNNIKKYKVQNNVHFLNSQNNPYPYIYNSDILVCLSSSETFNYTIAEAKVLNVPVVTTDFPSAYEFVEHNISGVISPVEKISETIFDLLTNCQLYSKIKDNLRRTSYSPSVVITQINGLLEGNEG